MKLVYKNNGAKVEVGQQVILKDGTAVTVEHFRKPHSPASEGKVTVRFDAENLDVQREFYVSVIGAEWIEREDREVAHPVSA